MLFDSLLKHVRDPERRLAVCRPAFEQLEDRLTPAARFSVGDVTIVEGNDLDRRAVVQVRLSQQQPTAVTVKYAALDGTATSGSDYGKVAGKLTFARGETRKSIRVPLLADRLAESDEYFVVRLSNSRYVKFADREAVVIVADDEPRISITSASSPEGNADTMSLRFTVSLATAYDRPVTVNYATTDASATAGTDYVANAGELIFAAGETSHAITVEVNGDRLPEPDKTFHVNVSTPDDHAQITQGVGVGAIMDDEPRISIADAYVYGETSFTFSVSLAATHDEVVQVNFATADGTALAGVDYAAIFGTLTFERGETTKTFTVDVLDPGATDKYLSVLLSDPSANAQLGNVSATGYLNWTWYDYGYGGYYDSYYDYGYYAYYDYSYCDYGYYDSGCYDYSYCA